MMTPFLSRAPMRRAATLGLACAALMTAVQGASASDGGLGDLLASIFGGRPQPAAAQPAPSRTQGYASAVTLHRRAHLRPLVVRLHPAKARLTVAQAPVKPGKVSIYEDRTLRRGDAVMTASGVRVFAGSTAWPYTSDDFVSLKDAKNFDRDTSKMLAQLDKLPRG